MRTATELSAAFHVLLAVAAGLLLLVAIQIWLGCSFMPTRRRSDYGYGSEYYLPRRAEQPFLFWWLMMLQVGFAVFIALLGA